MIYGLLILESFIFFAIVISQFCSLPTLSLDAIHAGKMVSFVYIPIYVYLSFFFYFFVGASKYCCPACRPHWYHINNGGK
jgi:hypothetical protein